MERKLLPLFSIEVKKPLDIDEIYRALRSYWEDLLMRADDIPWSVVAHFDDGRVMCLSLGWENEDQKKLSFAVGSCFLKSVPAVAFSMAGTTWMSYQAPPQNQHVRDMSDRKEGMIIVVKCGMESIAATDEIIRDAAGKVMKTMLAGLYDSRSGERMMPAKAWSDVLPDSPSSVEEMNAAREALRELIGSSADEMFGWDRWPEPGEMKPH